MSSIKSVAEDCTDSGEWADSEWTKSSTCDNHCVEVAAVGGMIAVRDSKNTAGSILKFSAAEWDAFVTGVKKGEFDV